jgi:superfamily I DNA and/or RNA helicase
MHPDIADFVADVFYGGSLENGVSASDRQLAFGVFGKAVCLVSTTAYKDRHEIIPARATSYQNPLEVEMTRRVLAQARQHLSVPATIGVLTPYAAQKDLMRKELSSFYADEGNVLFQQEDIASVDSFQGSERDIMIASFVRSPRKEAAKCRKCDGSGSVNGCSCQTCGGTGWQGAKLNWVQDLRRLNVAFSRARKMLILIGDVEALTNPKHGGTSGREVLERFRSHVQDRGKVLHVWEEPAYE